jgi:DNA-binding transcriptional ArsR family regulator
LTGIVAYGNIRVVMVPTLSALAEPNRLRIVALLRAGPRAVGEISTTLELRQPQVSKHLRMLKEAGLVGVRPVAQQRVYELRPEPFHKLHTWLEDYRRLWESRFDELDIVIEELERREKQKEKRRDPRRK